MLSGVRVYGKFKSIGITGVCFSRGNQATDIRAMLSYGRRGSHNRHHSNRVP
jgi:hypothetical protein